MRKGYSYIILMIAALIFISHDHMERSFGDRLFNAIGISPWTGANETGFHLSTILGFVLLFIGFTGAVRHIRPRYQKITSRLVLGCIAFILAFPLVTEGVMYVVKYNSHDVSSVDISKGTCNVRSEVSNLTLECSFDIYNYGRVETIAITPLLPPSSIDPADYQFKRHTLTFSPNARKGKMSTGMVFNGSLKGDLGVSGTIQDVEMEFEVIS